MMDIEKARERLKDDIQADGGLYNLGWYLGWNPGATHATLDGEYDADDLEAIAAYMRHAKR